MKISLNWLKEYIDLSDSTPQQISDTLTLIGLEVESMIDQNEIYKNFVVGFVKEKEKHPNADKLSLCIVNDGENDFQVICGAPNVDKGQKIVFAKIGAIVPKGNFKISKAKIRGVESNGMICSEAELELSENHEGILVLTDDKIIGQNISDALGLNDVILEIGITPNRPDALSHIGVARDLAAFYNKKLNLPEVNIKYEKSEINNFASVEIIDSVNCPRYSAKVVTGIEVKPSPEWLQNKLKNVGLRPINNIVDVTNYLMYEYGQPLHAFDLDLLKDNKIIIKQAGEISTFKTLDSKERKLEHDMLMICDGEKPVAVAGVMGGENSEITNSTKNILIESAYFNPSSVRKTAKKLGLSTDASYRFERGCDPSNTAIIAEKAAQLISEIAGGKNVDGIIDVFPNKIEGKEINFRYNRLNEILGYFIPVETVDNILLSLGFNIKQKNENDIKLISPTFRPDIEREIDVIEEIARIYGYDKIPAVEKISVTLGERKDDSDFLDLIRNVLTGFGLYEIMCVPLIDLKTAEENGIPVPLMNPLSTDMSHLRTSLIPGVLQTILRNIHSGVKSISVFEIGHVYEKKSDTINSFSDFEETEVLLIALSGFTNEVSWYEKERKFDFYDLKGIINSLLTKLSLEEKIEHSYSDSGNKIYDFGFSILNSEKQIGIGGKVSKNDLKKYDLEQDVFIFEIKIEELKQIQQKEKKFKELLRFPKVIRDAAFILDEQILFGEIQNFVRKLKLNFLKNVEIFDIFKSEQVGFNKKSLALRFEFFDEAKTLTEDEIEKEFSKIINDIKKQFNAELRGV